MINKVLTFEWIVAKGTMWIYPTTCPVTRPSHSVTLMTLRNAICIIVRERFPATYLIKRGFPGILKFLANRAATEVVASDPTHLTSLSLSGLDILSNPFQHPWSVHYILSQDIAYHGPIR